MPVCRMEGYASAGAVGAAVLASQCGKDPRSLPARFGKVGVEKVFEPDPSKKELYDRLFALYVQIYPSLKPMFHALKEFETVV